MLGKFFSNSFTRTHACLFPWVTKDIPAAFPWNATGATSLSLTGPQVSRRGEALTTVLDPGLRITLNDVLFGCCASVLGLFAQSTPDWGACIGETYFLVALEAGGPRSRC